VNGPLLAELAARINGDMGCVDFFREGSALCACSLVMGCVHFAIGAPLLDDDADWCRGRCKPSNTELLASLRADANEEQLHKIAFEDWEKHRMSEPVKANDIDTSQMLCCPRFGVAQGIKPDGSEKVRAVDHFSWSHSNGQKKRKRRVVKSDSVNGHFIAEMAIKHDHLDDLLAAMRLEHEATGQVRTLLCGCALSLFAVLSARYLDYGKQTLTQLSAVCHYKSLTSGQPPWCICTTESLG